MEGKFENYTLDITGDDFEVREKERIREILQQNTYVIEDISDDLGKLSDILTKYKTENTYYSLNVFTQYKRSACFPYSLFSDYQSVEDIPQKISTKFLSNQRIDEIAKRIDNSFTADELIKDEMINQYKSIKESIESLVVDSVNISVELEFYLQGIGKVLNIKKKKIAKGISKAIESQRS